MGGPPAPPGMGGPPMPGYVKPAPRKKIDL